MIIKSITITWVLMGSIAIAQDNKTFQSINVQFNKNVELLGFAYFLGYQGPEIDQKNDSFMLNDQPVKRSDWYAFGYEQYLLHKQFAGSQNVITALQLAEHIWIDYLINLLVQLNDFPNARLSEHIEEKYFIRFSDSGSVKEARELATFFISAMNRLYIEVNFDHYLNDNRRPYENALQQIHRILPPEGLIPAMESFYKRRFDSYMLVPSLTIPTGMGFGLRHTVNGKAKIFTVFGPLTFQHFKDDSRIDMGFNEERGCWS